MTGPTFRIDPENMDQSSASDGVSRFGYYMTHDRKRALESIWEDGQDPAAFAVIAWETAVSPWMSPPYVHHHPRVINSRLQAAANGLVAVVFLASPLPEALAGARSRWGGQLWRGWHRTGMGAGRAFASPDEESVAKHPHAVSTVTLMFPIQYDDLPYGGPDEDISARAREAIHLLVPRLNDTVDRVIDCLDGGG